MSKPLFLLIAVASMVLFSCREDALDVDVSDLSIAFETKRFEQDLFAKSTLSEKEIEQLSAAYPHFLSDFTTNIINIGSLSNPSAVYHLNAFREDPYINEVMEEVKKVYPDFSPIQEELKKAFLLYHYHFPDRNVPKIITYVSGFNYAIVADSSYLGLGLDMFLGKSYKAYNQLGIPQYKANNMTTKHLVPNAILGWVTTEFELQKTNPDLLTEMIHQGKILYLLDAFLPKAEDHLKIGYTTEQVSWCVANEKEIWFHFIDNDLLYNKANKEIIKYMGESPFVKGFPEGSPGRIGHWMGWQIVKAYMKNNPQTNVKTLMQKQDAQEILNNSKYKPV